jgi:cell wall-associated NlpC family hydrolase
MINALALLFPCLLSLHEAPVERPYHVPLWPAINYSTSDNIAANNNITAYGPTVKNENKTNIDREQLITFAQTLKGVRYKYASANPKTGFDCSGFVKYVFNHFQMRVPRTSKGLSGIGKEIDLQSAMPGDVILFTGSNSAIRKVGHVGIITQAGDTISFIHAASGKTYRVTETTLTPHYKRRFIKVVRVLE